MSPESVFDRLAHEAYFHVLLLKWQRRDTVQTGSDGKPQWTVRIDAEAEWADGTVVPDILIEGSKRWIGELGVSVALVFLEQWRQLQEPAVGQLRYWKAIATEDIKRKEQLELALMLPMELLDAFDRHWHELTLTVTLKDLELRSPDHRSISGWIWRQSESPVLYVSEFIVTSPVISRAEAQ